MYVMEAREEVEATADPARLRQLLDQSLDHEEKCVQVGRNFLECVCACVENCFLSTHLCQLLNQEETCLKGGCAGSQRMLLYFPTAAATGAARGLPPRRAGAFGGSDHACPLASPSLTLFPPISNLQELSEAPPSTPPPPCAPAPAPRALPHWFPHPPTPTPPHTLSPAPSHQELSDAFRRGDLAHAAEVTTQLRYVKRIQEAIVDKL